VSRYLVFITQLKYSMPSVIATSTSCPLPVFSLAYRAAKIELIAWQLAERSDIWGKMT